MMMNTIQERREDIEKKRALGEGERKRANNQKRNNKLLSTHRLPVRLCLIRVAVS